MRFVFLKKSIVCVLIVKEQKSQYTSGYTLNSVLVDALGELRIDV